MAEAKETKTKADAGTPDNATTNPEDTVEGQSFYNSALTGSGTITADGTYAEPLPDPTQVRGIGPDRTSGGRLVLSHLDPEATKVAEVTEAVVGTRPDPREGFRRESTADAGSSEDGTAKRGTSRGTATK